MCSSTFKCVACVAIETEGPDFFIRNCVPVLHGRVLITDARIQLAMSMLLALNLSSCAIFIRILGRKKKN